MKMKTFTCLMTLLLALFVTTTASPEEIIATAAAAVNSTSEANLAWYEHSPMQEVVLVANMSSSTSYPKTGERGPGDRRDAELAGFTGILQVDGYAAYDALTDGDRIGGPVTLALCWSHFRRRFYDIAKGGNAPIANEALQRIGVLYEIEADIRGRASDERRAVRQVIGRDVPVQLHQASARVRRVLRNHLPRRAT